MLKEHHRWRPGSTMRLAVMVAGATALTAAVTALWVARPFHDAAISPNGAGPLQPSSVKLGLSIHEPGAFPGYTLLAPLKSMKTYLIDMQGRVVQTWNSHCTPALGAYLLENGHLLRTGLLPGAPLSAGPGAGGRVQEFTWDGRLVWDFQFANDRQLPHHDFTRLPNGNVLLILWEERTPREVIAAGRRPDLVGRRFLLDGLIEIKPTGKTTGEIAWEWHLWDHLVQDHDPSKASYGNVAEHPELVDINFWMDPLGVITRTRADVDKLRSIGYAGASGPGKPSKDNLIWSHFNAVAYDPELDQVMVSVHGFSEVWIIDHSTTTQEAAGHAGGRSGKGGDLLYRWGNPEAYRAGTKAERRLFAQHDAHWIPRGLPGAGHLLLFNNGAARPDGNYSSVEELVLPIDKAGRYAHRSGAAYGPDKPRWNYSAPNKSDFYSVLLSGAQRLPNGNTLICSGINGTVLEVTPEKEVVWKYINPIQGLPAPGRSPKATDANSVFNGPPGGGSLFRVHRYGRDYPGLAGKELRPGDSLEELAEAAGR